MSAALIGTYQAGSRELFRRSSGPDGPPSKGADH